LPQKIRINGVRLGRLPGFRWMSVFYEALKLALTSIWSHKLRSFLTLIGVIIGVAAVMVVGSFLSGLEVYVNDNVTSILGSNTFLVARIAGVRMSEEEYLKKLRTHKRITEDDYQAIVSKSKYAKVVGAEMGSRIDLKLKEHELFDTQLSGCTASLPEIANINIESGRFLLPFEVEHAHQVCVIGWSVKEELFPGEDPLNHTLKVKGLDCTIVGVLAKRGSFFGQSMDNTLYIPISMFEKIYGSRRSWGIRVKTEPGEAFNLAQEEVRLIMRNQHHQRPGQEDNFDILVIDQINQSVSDFTRPVKMIVTPITIIFLLIGGIVIMNIMLASVSERNREIGIRRAVGARRRDLLLQFVLEAAVMGLIGGVFGLALAYSIVASIMAATDLTLAITTGYIVMSLSISGGIGILFGMYPAVKASKLDPIRALSYEA
jgi:putative ABC transport system permease protein